MGIKELLAAKRAAEAAAAAAIGTVTPPASIEEKEEETAAPEPVKKKTFSEMMAERKAAAQAILAPEAPAPTLQPPAIDKEAALRTGTINPALDAHPPQAAVVEETKEQKESPETEQAYADIKARIELLESLEDTQLEGAMKELKKALMANPNAVALMLDTDIGQMVIALRRLTKEAQVEAVKEKKTNGNGKKAKNVVLTAEQIAEAFDDL